MLLFKGKDAWNRISWRKWDKTIEIYIYINTIIIYTCIYIYIVVINDPRRTMSA